MNCINVSHAEVIITLIGRNELLCKAGNKNDGYNDSEGAALAKDGMDGQLYVYGRNAV